MPSDDMPLRKRSAARMPELGVLMVASEVAPWAKTGGLADVLSGLPEALDRLGHRVTIVLPRYRGMTLPAAESTTRVISGVPPLRNSRYASSAGRVNRRRNSAVPCWNPSIAANPGCEAFGAVVAYFGGTMFNFINATGRGTGEYVGKPESYWFNQYAENAARFKKIAADAGADIYLSNHTAFDGSKEALPMLAARKPGDPNPLIVGKDSVQRYLTVVGECARAGALKAK